VEDAIVLLLRMASASNEAQQTTQRARVEVASAQREEATARMVEKLNEAIAAAAKAAAERDDGGPFDFITDNLGPAALLGLVTGAAYLVAADFAAHATGLDDTKLDLADGGAALASVAGPAGLFAHAVQLAVKRCGPEAVRDALSALPTIDDADVRKANALALTVTEAQLALAATVASGGTATPALVAMVGVAISASTQLASQTGLLETAFGDDARWVALGGTAVGAGLGVGGSVALAGASGAGKAASLLGQAKTVIEGVGEVRSGIRALSAAEHARDADLARVEAKSYQQAAERIGRLVTTILEELQEHEAKTARVNESLTSALQVERRAQMSSLKV